MIEILPLTDEYLEPVTELDTLVFPHTPWGRSSFSGNMQNSYDHPLIAVDQGKVLGYGILRQIDSGEVLLIGVHPDYRRRGIGKQLMKALLDEANRGENIFLEVRDSNQPAKALYESLGFSEIARRHSYYRDPVEDAVIMML